MLDDRIPTAPSRRAFSGIPTLRTNWIPLLLVASTVRAQDPVDSTYEAAPDSVSREVRLGDEVRRLPSVVRRVDSKVRYLLMAGGEFIMGLDESDPAVLDRLRNNPDDDLLDDVPARSVRVAPFYVQETECSIAEVRERPPRDSGVWSNLTAKRDGGLPATGLTWNQARDYARSIGGDLPTEAQWEYATRSGGKRNRLYPWSDPAIKREALGRVFAVEPGPHSLRNVSGVSPREAVDHDVTDDGVRGLLGNAREWCLDNWRSYKLDALPPLRDQPVVRGGSYRTPYEHITATWPRRVSQTRDRDSWRELAEHHCADDLGFRVVLNPTSEWIAAVVRPKRPAEPTVDPTVAVVSGAAPTPSPAPTWPWVLAGLAAAAGAGALLIPRVLRPSPPPMLTEGGTVELNGRTYQAIERIDTGGAAVVWKVTEAEPTPGSTRLRSHALLFEAASPSGIAATVYPVVERERGEILVPSARGGRSRSAGPGVLLKWAETRDDLEVDDVVSIYSKKYTLESRAGSGGMSHVWKARDHGLRRPVALKILAGVDPKDRREGRVLAGLSHPNVPEVFEQDEVVRHWGTGLAARVGCFGIAMKYVDGFGLDHPEVRRHITLGEIRELLLQVCDLLEYLETGATYEGSPARVLHLDLKPANILKLDATSRTTTGYPLCPIKIIDFGVCRVIDPATDEIVEDLGAPPVGTHSFRALTPAYASPEQAVPGGRITRKSDVFSLGVVLYELLARKHPFSGGPAATPAGCLGRRLIPFDWVKTTVTSASPCTEALEHVKEHIHSCLSENPDNRPEPADLARNLGGNLRILCDAGLLFLHK